MLSDEFSNVGKKRRERRRIITNQTKGEEKNREGSIYEYEKKLLKNKTKKTNKSLQNNIKN